jgi:hypothetical protein
MSQNEPPEVQAFKDTASKLMADRVNMEAIKQNIVANKEEYKIALNGVASTPNGKVFLKTLIKACGVFAVTRKMDGMALVEDKALRYLYLEHIRPYLDVQLRKELED